jgi:hypothetical protein
MGKIIWMNEPEEQDYGAAVDYLSLLADDKLARELVERLRNAPVVHGKAKDIMRSSRLPLLPVDDQHVAKDLAKVKAGKPLSPVLLVRGDLAAGVPLQVADGYHRVCASYHLGEDEDIPCRIVSLTGK